ncbi:MAG: SRPBCC domain-containing protein [Silvibacterium sp.]|nr:SRPBCC domain-containing protein [Silvibacterium sp.]
MITTLTASEIENLSLLVEQEIHVDAPLDVTFEALLEQLGPGSEKPDGAPMPLTLEPWPGGRWFRDLGNENGHFWGNVQAIKRPMLLEFSGPLFMSHPVTNNVQYRLSAEGNGTLIRFRHSGFGLVQEEQKRGIQDGWRYIHDKVRERAEKSR